MFLPSHRSTRETLVKIEEAVETLNYQLVLPQHFSQTSTPLFFLFFHYYFEIKLQKPKRINHCSKGAISGVLPLKYIALACLLVDRSHYFPAE